VAVEQRSNMRSFVPSMFWNSAGQEYNPDLIVIETDGTRWVVEVKMDKEMNSADVQAKREAAQRWANHVNADASVTTTWRYLLVSESDVDTAKGRGRRSRGSAVEPALVASLSC
jgi:hypothetical protein